MSQIQLPDNYSVVILRISLWHAKRTLKSEHLGLNKDISKRLAHLGNMNSFDPEVIKEFRNANNQANAACSKYGVRFGNGYLIPNSRIDWLLSTLETIKERFYKLKIGLLHRYETELSLWADEAEKVQAGFGKFVSENAYPKDYIDRQIQFGWHGLDEEIKQLGNSLLDEVAEKAREKIVALEDRKSATIQEFKVSRKDLPILESIKNKLLVNTMLDQRVQPIIDLIDELLDQVPNATGSNKALPAGFTRKYIVVMNALTKPELIYGFNEDDDQPIDQHDIDVFASFADKAGAKEPEIVIEQKEQSSAAITNGVVTPLDADWLDIF